MVTFLIITGSIKYTQNYKINNELRTSFLCFSKNNEFKVAIFFVQCFKPSDYIN